MPAGREGASVFLPDSLRQFRLPRKCLLKKNQDFVTVYRHGRRVHGAGFSIIFLENGRECSRIGISISRKIKGAVVRNRIKRIFRESFRLQRDTYPRGADIVISVRPGFSVDSPARISKAVERVLKEESG
ncbi:MAG: ribonuclease P protein component [Proteobacteria bacterium]|nr:MAG: ribonuclease P protein component [Pseudomonadota bacterium]PIE65257.1 MAG: ribonuclease P protein component [Desulfobacterales bacterium]